MPRLVDRRTGHYMGSISTAEYDQLCALLAAEPAWDEDTWAFDEAMLDRLADAGASERVMLLFRQIEEGRGGFDPGWEPD
jgi:hypothetical protein